MSQTAGHAEEQVGEERRRGAFSSRRVFILAAIGSAVGLGNIWRFPYIAYENGGGAFLLPYLVALLTVGIPFLLLDYAIGHRHRGSAPLSFARLRRGTEGLGWRLLTGVVAPTGLGVVFVLALRNDFAAPYEDYPAWLLLGFGWLLVVALPLVAFLVARLPWRAGTYLEGPPPDSDAVTSPAAATTDPSAGDRPATGHEGGPR
jgi:hypothetical protein